MRDEAGVVPGANADAALHFGRDLLLRLSGPLALQSVVAHELGHNLLDAVWGAGPALSGPAPDDLSAAQLAALDAALRAAWPRLLQSACQRHGQPVEPGDARGWVSDGGVSLMVTHERLPGGAYFHASLTGQGGPIDLAAGALHACLPLLLRQVGVEPMQAALVYSARGMLHLGFRGDAPPPLCPAAPVDAAVADSAAWLAAMRQAGRLGDQEAQRLPVVEDRRHDDQPTSPGRHSHAGEILGNCLARDSVGCAGNIGHSRGTSLPG